MPATLLSSTYRQGQVQECAVCSLWGETWSDRAAAVDDTEASYVVSISVKFPSIKKTHKNLADQECSMPKQACLSPFKQLNLAGKDFLVREAFNLQAALAAVSSMGQ